MKLSLTITGERATYEHGRQKNEPYTAAAVEAEGTNYALADILRALADNIAPAIMRAVEGEVEG